MSGVQTLANPHRIKAAHRRRRKVASGQSVQRYYDPGIGRFLSVDPVTADGSTGSNFNRYWYANNNPYKFTDPDGRLPLVLIPIGGGIAGGVINIGAQMAKAKGSFTERLSQVNWKQVGVATGAGVLGGSAGAVASTAATTGGVIAANAVAGAAIGATAAHASAAVEGQTASTGDVVKGAAIGGVLSGTAGAAAAAPGAAGRAASSSMTQTEKAATGNLVQGVANTTRSAGGTPNFTPAGQGLANGAATTISNADNFRAQPKPEDFDK